MANRHSNFPANIGFVLPHLKAGGIEQGVLHIVNGLDRAKYRPFLFLNRAEGIFLDQLKADVKIIDGRGRRAISSALSLSKSLSEHAIDVVYSGTNAMNIATSLARKRMAAAARPAHIISEHTTPADYFKTAKLPKLRRILVRNLYPSADILAAPLPGLAEMWLEYLGLSRPATAVLSNPVITDKAIADIRLQKSARDPNHIMAAGRLHRDKGFDVLLEAFAQLVSQNPALRLTLFGEGKQRAALTDQISKLQLLDHVSMPGHQANLPDVFATAALVVVPSRREGFGNIVIEALAAGTPIVATDCFGPKAILQSAGCAARVVRVGSGADLAGGITAALADEKAAMDAKKLGPGIAAQYTHRAAIVAFESLLNRLLA